MNSIHWFARLKILLRGDPEQMLAELLRSDCRAMIDYCLIICLGCGLYGFTVGIWRAPVQSLYTALKFPLLIFLTAGGNGLLNGMLAQVLGSGLSFRQTFLAILMSFAIAAVILGALSPVTLLVVLNAPPLGSDRDVTGHSVVLLTHVFLIAYAGILANRHLLRLLTRSSGGYGQARRILLSWLAGNLLLGSQLAWVLRPFFGSPRLAVQFFRHDPLRGNFYEAVGHALIRVFF
ncbi:MAG: hypothetical protein JWO45_67 [Spartobacteria bacterium]|nr:hypothetical protein [Spartobacteria bacterium]